MTKTKHKKLIRSLLNVFLIFIITILAIYYILKDDPQKTFSLFKQVNLYYVILSFVLFYITVIIEGFILFFEGRLFNKEYSYKDGLINSITSSFMTVLYKSASFVIQGYTYSKQGIDKSTSASLATMRFLIYQAAFTIFSTVMVFIGYNYVKDIPIELLGGIKILTFAIIGLIIALAFLIFLITIAFSTTIHQKAISFFVNILYKIKLIKNPEERKYKYFLTLATYKVNLKSIFKHKTALFFLVILDILKIALLTSLPYFIFLSFNIPSSSLDFLSIFSGNSYLSLISSFLIVGAPEVGFQSIFSTLISIDNISNYVSASNLLWRTITFYTPLIFGGLSFVLYKGKRKRLLLSDTKTLFDIVPLYPTFSPIKIDLLDINGVEISFKELREEISQRDKVKTIYNIDGSLTEQKKVLADVYKEAQELKKHTINKEVDIELNKVINKEKKDENRNIH